MTAIVWCRKTKTLAADRQATSGDQRSEVSKLLRHGDELLAIFGPATSSMELRAWYLTGAVASAFPESCRSNGAGALVVIKQDGFAWLYDDSPCPLLHPGKRLAFGCGREGALVALNLGCTAKQAVLEVAKVNVACGMGVDTLTLRKAGI